MSNRLSWKCLGVLLLAIASCSKEPVLAPVVVQGAWVRPTVGDQDSTGAYFTITAHEPLTLVGVSTPAAEIVQIHETRMDGDIMRMRMAQRIVLKPGEPLVFKPGGYHVMLMALTGPIVTGQEINLNLKFEKAGSQTLEIPVKVLASHKARPS